MRTPASGSEVKGRRPDTTASSLTRSPKPDARDQIAQLHPVQHDDAGEGPPVQRHREGLDADRPARRMDVAACDCDRRLVEREGQVQVGEVGDRSPAVAIRRVWFGAVVRGARLVKSMVPLRPFTAPGRAGEVQARDDQAAGAGPRIGVLAPVQAAGEGGRAGRGRLDEVGGQRAEVGGLQSVLGEDQVRRVDDDAAFTGRSRHGPGSGGRARCRCAPGRSRPLHCLVGEGRANRRRSGD